MLYRSIPILLCLLLAPLRRRLFRHPLEFMLPVEPRQESRTPQ